MLNKDEYNKEEYNDYYQQEIRGAETSGLKEEESSGKSKLLILVGLIVLAIAGYFGYKSINTSSTDCATDETLVVQNEVEKPAKTTQTGKEEPTGTEETVQAVEKVVKPAEAVQMVKEKANTPKNDEKTQISDNVKKSMGDEEKMSPEEIAKVVQMVMSQMNTKTEVAQNGTKAQEETTSLNNELMSELSDTDTDSVNNGDKQLEDAINNINEKTKDTSIKSDDKAIDTYNKVKIAGNTGDDELSKLSSQISNLISDKSTTDKQIDNSKKEEVYTESLKEEVVTRKNEMRIIVVRKGDTLGKIAKRAYGNVMEYKKIYKANPDMLNRPDRIYIGQKLRIPK